MKKLMLALSVVLLMPALAGVNTAAATQLPCDSGSTAAGAGCFTGAADTTATTTTTTTKPAISVRTNLVPANTSASSMLME